jgi:addiction module HigA family antidote
MKNGISADMALRLKKAFGTAADLLLRMQAAYNLAQAWRYEADLDIERYQLA